MPEERIVCNSGPLIALSNIGHLQLLEGLYRQVLIPDAVFREVVESGFNRRGAQEVKKASWLERVSLEMPPELLLASELGEGEAEVITLAHQVGASLVLIDERRARRIAEHVYGLRPRGSAGILVAAKRAGLVTVVRPLLGAMRDSGYFLSQRLIDRACLEAGES